MAPVGVSGLEAFGLAPSPQQTSLAIVREALMRVSSDDRAVLLLRDQCHLPLDQVAAVMGVSGREIQRVCLTARERLRMKVKEQLETPERKNGL